MNSSQLEKRRPFFFAVNLNLFESVIYSATKSSLLCGPYFYNKRLASESWHLVNLTFKARN